MKFEIDFNREIDDKVLEELGAVSVPVSNEDKYGPFERYMIELNTFEELEALLIKVDAIKKNMHSAIISFDPPVIYLDKDV